MYVCPGVAQYTINGSYQGRTVANVLHWFIDTTGTIQDRNDAVVAMAGIVINQWKADIMPRLSTQYSFNQVTYLDLNSEDGITGVRASTSTVTLPQAGTNSGAATPANVAVLLRKNVSGQRGVRKGRIYCAPITETDTDSTASNKLSSAAITAWTTAANNFLGNTNQTTGGPIVYDSWMVVNHVLTREEPTAEKPVGDPLTGVGIRVSSLSLDNVLATQRRRLRG